MPPPAFRRQSGYPCALMLPLSRRLTTALLWLAIALLPIRGLAAAVAPVAMAGVKATSAANAIMAPADHAAPAAPCHGAAADSTNDEIAATTDGSHACAMCDLCHVSMAQGSFAGISLPTLPATLPRAATATPLQPRAPDGLFRPPRTFLA